MLKKLITSVAVLATVAAAIAALVVAVASFIGGCDDADA